MSQGSEKTFFQRKQIDSKQTHEKMLNHQGNANQNHNETPSHTYQKGCYQKDEK